MNYEALKYFIPELYLHDIIAGLQSRNFTEKQAAIFVAQTSHESAGFSRIVENLNYSEQGLLKTFPTRVNINQAKQLARKPEKIANHVYANRLGNTLPGDGWLFRGRGILQVTGMANYKDCSLALYKDWRLLTNPDILLNPKDAVLSAFWFWDKKNLQNANDIPSSTRIINGGLNGLADRQKKYSEILKAINEK